MAPLNPWKLTGYKPGQNVACQIMAAEPGGYAVLIPRDNLPGFLPTEAKLKIGEDVLAQFVCVHNNRVLLSARFSGSGSAIAAQQGSSYTTTAKSAAAQIDWSAQVATGADPADAAFSVWSQTVPRKIHLRRATDLILPPVDGQEPQTIVMGENDLDWISYQTPRSGWSSTLTLTIFTLPAHAVATSSNTDLRTWQGRLHGAEKATMTGCSDLRTSDLKFVSSISTVCALSAFMFLTASQI